MTTHASQKENNTHRRKDTAFGKRIAIKVFAVFVVVGTFNLIRGIEAAKRSYDEKHNRPIVIVDQGLWSDCDAALKSTQVPVPAKCGDARLVNVELIRNTLVPGMDLTARQLTSLGDLVDKIKYQNFQGETDILQRLDAEILATADYSKRIILATQESERKSMLNKEAELKHDEGPVEEKLRLVHKKEEDYDRKNNNRKDPFPEFKPWLDKKLELLRNKPLPTYETVDKWRLRLNSTDVDRGRRTKPSGLGADELISWYRKITNADDKITNADDRKLNHFNQKIKEFDDDARKETKFIYEKLKPELPGLISNALNSQPSEENFLARFDPTGIYDEKSGTHVVYQTLWMTCAMVLVFGFLFAVFLILRLIPGVAEGMEVLKSNAGNLFSQAGMAIPQTGKSLLVGAATLGVGAAVAVGGTAGVSQLHLVESETIRRDDGKTGERGKTGDPGKPGAPGKPGERGPEGWPSDPFTGTLTVALQGPIPLPSPFIIKGPETVTLSGASLQALENYITQLSRPALSEEITTKMKEVAEEKIKTLDIESLKDRLRQLEAQKPDPHVSAIDKNLNSFTTTFGEQLTEKLRPLQDEMTATKTAIEGLNAQPGSGPRNLFSRLKRAFKGDKYSVTYQSLTSLGLLIRTSAGKNCPTTAPSSTPCCSSASPIATCRDELILSSLASMIGEPSRDEQAFWTRLKEIWQPKWDAEKARAAKENESTTNRNIEEWKVLILRQTRVAY